MKFLVYKILIFMAITFALCILVSCKGKEYTYQERKWQSTCLNSSEKMAVADFTMQCSAGTCRASFAFYNTLEEIDRFVLCLEKTLQMLG